MGGKEVYCFLEGSNNDNLRKVIWLNRVLLVFRLRKQFPGKWDIENIIEKG